MNCVLHDLARHHQKTPRARHALTVLFGLSLCSDCSDHVAKALADGCSVRDLIVKARGGEVPGVESEAPPY